MNILNNRAVVDSQVHIVDGCRRLVGDTAVVAPQEHPFVVAGGGKIEFAGLGLPSVVEIEASAAVESDTAGGHSGTVVETAIGACSQDSGSRYQGDTHKVKAALTLTLPVEGIDIGTRVGQTDGAGGKDIAFSSAVVAVAAAVVTDIECLATAIVHGAANHPLAVLAAIDKIPAVAAGALKVAAERYRCRQAGKGGKGGACVTARVVAAVGGHIHIIQCACAKTRQSGVGVVYIDDVGTTVAYSNFTLS